MEVGVKTSVISKFSYSEKSREAHVKTRHTRQVPVELSLWSPDPVVWGTRRKICLVAEDSEESEHGESGPRLPSTQVKILT